MNSAKYCLKLQNKDNQPTEHICEYCQKNCTNKYNLECHMDICKHKMEYLVDKKNEEIVHLQAKICDSDKEVQKLEEVIIQKNLEIAKLQTALDIYQKENEDLKLMNITNSMVTTNNTTYNNNNTNITINMIPFDIDLILRKFTEVIETMHFSEIKDGQRFIGKQLASCTKNEDGKIEQQKEVRGCR